MARKYRYRPGRSVRAGRPHWGSLALLLISAALVVWGAAVLLGDFGEKKAAETADAEMRAVYRAEPGTPAEEAAPKPTEAPVLQEEAIAAANPVLLPSVLAQQPYYRAPGASLISRFQALQKKNMDVIGWLTIGSMIDEAVVQRDNEFYMNHDVTGKKNSRGAVFLDEGVSLQTRPYTLILYGHNMRDMSRFGWLKKYENPDFYQENQLIDFSTLYEKGRYVVFSLGTVSTQEEDANYLDFYGLNSLRTDDRAQAIRVLQNVSVLECEIDVRADDQILLLVTCVDKDTNRRVVAARRIREGENEAAFK